MDAAPIYSAARPLVFGLMLGFFPVLSVQAAGQSGATDLVKRGEYLMRVGDCAACHTAKADKPFAGGKELQTPFGSISTPNITPDKATGIGNWTDEEFYRAMHDGIGRNGEYLYPAFPFPWYTNASRDDVKAIKAYLFSLAPVNAPRQPVHFAFPFNIREGLLAWRAAFFQAAKPFDNAPTGNSVARGKYLVDGFGHCGECHNRENLFGASPMAGRLEGGAITGWFAPNITSDGRQGVGSWTTGQIVKFLKTGAAPGQGVVLGPMEETIHDSLRYLNDDDLHAIAAYLKSVPAQKTYKNIAATEEDRRRPPGAEGYLSHCASCHGVDGKGVKGEVPALAGNGAVTAGGPENVIDVVLGGLPATHGLGPMPAVGAGMSDSEIADIVNYVRNNFGNIAPATAEAGLVGDLRAKARTAMLGRAAGDCRAVKYQPVADLLNGGGEDQLKNATPLNLLSTIDAIVGKLKKMPNIDRDAAVNALTDGYCKIVTAETKAAAEQREERIGNFAVLVYSEFQSAGS